MIPLSNHARACLLRKNPSLVPRWVEKDDSPRSQYRAAFWKFRTSSGSYATLGYCLWKLIIIFLDNCSARIRSASCSVSCGSVASNLTSFWDSSQYDSGVCNLHQLRTFNPPIDYVGYRSSIVEQIMYSDFSSAITNTTIKPKKDIARASSCTAIFVFCNRPNILYLNLASVLA